MPTEPELTAPPEHADPAADETATNATTLATEKRNGDPFDSLITYFSSFLSWRPGDVTRVPLVLLQLPFQFNRAPLDLI